MVKNKLDNLCENTDLREKLAIIYSQGGSHTKVARHALNRFWRAYGDGELGK